MGGEVGPSSKMDGPKNTATQYYTRHTARFRCGAGNCQSFRSHTFLQMECPLCVDWGLDCEGGAPLDMAT